jgi:hypothetical protein
MATSVPTSIVPWMARNAAHPVHERRGERGDERSAEKKIRL